MKGTFKFSIAEKSFNLAIGHDDKFNLNGVDVSKDDLTLILELLGFELHETSSDHEFFMETLKTVSQFTSDDFQIFDDFMGWDAETKNKYRSNIPLVRFKLSVPLN